MRGRGQMALLLRLDYRGRNGELEARIAALLAAPAGRAFLLIAVASRLAPENP
jgi:hypothetical protein